MHDIFQTKQSVYKLMDRCCPSPTFEPFLRSFEKYLREKKKRDDYSQKLTEILKRFMVDMMY